VDAIALRAVAFLAGDEDDFLGSGVEMGRSEGYDREEDGSDSHGGQALQERI
jgi:hypothetical protein